MIRSIFAQEITPEIYRFKDALLSAVAFDRGNKTSQGALYDHFGHLIVSSLRPGRGGYRPIDPATISRADPIGPEMIELERGIYGGHFFYAWGHFLIETLSTAHALDLDQSIPVVFTPWELVAVGDWARGYMDHVKPLLVRAWGDRPVLLAAKPVHFGEVIVPTRLSCVGMNKALHPSFDKMVFQRLRDSLSVADGHATEQLVVMRDPTHRRWHPEEANTYSLFGGLGFKSVVPRDLDVVKQVKIISSAGSIIGFSGSILHNAIFMRAGATVVEIGDSPTQTRPNPLQAEICAMRHQKHVFVPGFMDQQPRSADEIVGAVASALAETKILDQAAG